MHLVDTVDVSRQDLERYLELLCERIAPVMTEAGASLLSCATTEPSLDPVTVQVAWGFDDFVQWNDIRRRLVLDPRWSEVARRARTMQRGGTRRFYRTVPLASGPVAPVPGPVPGPVPTTA